VTPLEEQIQDYLTLSTNAFVLIGLLCWAFSVQRAIAQLKGKLLTQQQQIENLQKERLEQQILEQPTAEGQST